LVAKKANGFSSVPPVPDTPVVPVGFVDYDGYVPEVGGGKRPPRFNPPYG